MMIMWTVVLAGERERFNVVHSLGSQRPSQVVVVGEELGMQLASLVQ